MLDSLLAQLKIFRVEFKTDDGPVVAAEDTRFDVCAGETVCVVGESAGRQDLFFDRDAKNGSVTDVAEADDLLMRSICDKDIGMIFQEQMSRRRRGICPCRRGC